MAAEATRDPVERTPLLEVLFEAVTGAVLLVAPDSVVIDGNRAGFGLLSSAAKKLAPLFTNWPSTSAIERTTVGPEGHSSRVLRQRLPEGLLVIVEDPSALVDPLGTLVEKWRLTKRQHDVLRGVELGLSNKEIAERLGCSYRTVEAHVTALLMKAGVDSRTRLLARARELTRRPFAA